MADNDTLPFDEPGLKQIELAVAMVMQALERDTAATSSEKGKALIKFVLDEVVNKRGFPAPELLSEKWPWFKSFYSTVKAFFASRMQGDAATIQRSLSSLLTSFDLNPEEIEHIASGVAEHRAQVPELVVKLLQLLRAAHNELARTEAQRSSGTSPPDERQTDGHQAVHAVLPHRVEETQHRELLEAVTAIASMSLTGEMADPGRSDATSESLSSHPLAQLLGVQEDGFCCGTAAPDPELQHWQVVRIQFFSSYLFEEGPSLNLSEFMRAELNDLVRSMTNYTKGDMEPFLHAALVLTVRRGVGDKDEKSNTDCTEVAVDRVKKGIRIRIAAAGSQPSALDQLQPRGQVHLDGEWPTPPGTPQQTLSQHAPVPNALAALVTLLHQYWQLPRRQSYDWMDNTCWHFIEFLLQGLLDCKYWQMERYRKFAPRLFRSRLHAM